MVMVGCNNTSQLKIAVWTRLKQFEINRRLTNIKITT